MNKCDVLGEYDGFFLQYISHMVRRQYDSDSVKQYCMRFSVCLIELYEFRMRTVNGTA